MNLRKLTKAVQNNEKLTEKAVDKSNKEFDRIDVKKALENPKKYLKEFLKTRVEPMLIETNKKGFAQGRRNAR